MVRVRMLKHEAVKYLENYSSSQCPKCKLIAARIVMRYPQNIKTGILDRAEGILWNYTGKEKHI